MKTTFRRKLLLVAQFSILFAQLVGLGFVLVGQANDVSGTPFTADNTVTIDSTTS